MIDQVENGIISYLTEQWPDNGGSTPVHQFDINLDFEDLLKLPAISVGTVRMQVREITGGDFQIRPTIGLYSVYKNVNRPDYRRQAVYPIVIAQMQLLAGQTLGLDIDELIPTSCDEVRHEKLKSMGVICFETLFTTGFTVESLDPQDAVQLLSENLKYYLGETNENENATDLITY